MTLPKALRLSMAKVADDLFDLALAAIAIKVENVAGDDLQEIFDGHNLLMLLDGPTGRPGAVTLDPLLVGALIQQQTMAQVLPDGGADPRPMTDTDAAVTAPFVNALIRRAATLPDAEADKRLLDGHAFGSRVENTRLICLALEAPLYRLITVTVDIAGGVRQGQILFCLPVPERATAPAPTEARGQEVAGTGSQEPSLLSQSVLALDVGLTIALARLRMPLAKLGDLRVGDTLELVGARFDRAEVLKPGGGRLARGVLGQMNGLRALRIVPEPGTGQDPRRRASDRGMLDQREPAPLSREADRPMMDHHGDAPAAPATLLGLPDMELNTPDLNLPDLNLPDLDLSDLDDLSQRDYDLPAVPDLSERQAG